MSVQTLTKDSNLDVATFRRQKRVKNAVLGGVLMVLAVVMAVAGIMAKLG